MTNQYYIGVEKKLLVGISRDNKIKQKNLDSIEPFPTLVALSISMKKAPPTVQLIHPYLTVHPLGQRCAPLGLHIALQN